MDIIVENLTKKYGVQRAVDDISFKVNTGEILGFLGPNGAGKTTVMKAITNFFAPTQGSIKIGEYLVNEFPEKAKSLIGYLPEENPLYYDMPVIDYLKYVARLQDMPDSKIPDRIFEMIRVCGLDKEKHKKIGELSKGYKQRVGLAQALIHDPAVLILDEPTEGLDPNQIVEIRELIKKIGREKTVILSSHILAEVEATCDRIMIINNGKIVADGSATELRKSAQGNEIIKLSVKGGEINTIFNSLKELDSVESVDFASKEEKELLLITSKKDKNTTKDIFDLCVKNNWYISQLTPIETKLEDIFRKLTQN